MIKKLNRIILLVIFIEIILWISSRAYAAGISIKTSKSTVKPGESFTVTVSVTNGAGKVSASVSNGSGGFGSTWLENSSKSFTCKAGNSGNVTIKTSGTVADFTTEKDEDASRSKSVTIKKESISKSEKKKVTTTKKQQNSKENKDDEKEEGEERLLLKNLNIDTDNVKLDPEFKSDVFEYTAYVKDLEKINISAEPNSNQSFVDIIGNENLQYGENYIIINLRGQDDKNNAEYKIKVIKEKSELTIAKEEIDALKKNNNLIKIFCISLCIILVLNIAILIILISRLRKRKIKK